MGPVLDAAARSAYRARLDTLTVGLDVADRVGDRVAAEKMEAERTAVLAELRRAVGLGGRGRLAAPEAERARVNVTRTLRATIERVAAAAPGAAAHLRASVRTGVAAPPIPLRTIPENGDGASAAAATTSSMVWSSRPCSHSAV